MSQEHPPKCEIPQKGSSPGGFKTSDISRSPLGTFRQVSPAVGSLSPVGGSPAVGSASARSITNSGEHPEVVMPASSNTIPVHLGTSTRIPRDADAVERLSRTLRKIRDHQPWTVARWESGQIRTVPGYHCPNPNSSGDGAQSRVSRPSTCRCLTQLEPPVRCVRER